MKRSMRNSRSSRTRHPSSQVIRANRQRRPNRLQVEKLEERTMLDGSGVQVMTGPTDAIVPSEELARSIDVKRLREESVEPPQLEFENGMLRFGSFLVHASNSQLHDPVAASLDFLDRYQHLYHLVDPRSQLVLKRIVSDPDGGQHVFFQQAVQTVPVFGSDLVVHLEGEFVAGTSGNYLAGPPELSSNVLLDSYGRALPTVMRDRFGRPVPAVLRDSNGEPTPALLRAEDANQVVAAEAGGGTGETIGEPQLMLFDRRLLGDDGTFETHLAWRVSVPSGLVFVDASSGKVLRQLETSKAERDIQIMDAAGDTEDHPFCGSSFTDLYTEDGRTDDYHGGDGDADAAFDLSNQLYDFWRDTFHRDSYDNDGEQIEVIVNASVGVVVAHYRSACDNFEFDDATVLPDIFGHEFTHAVTDSTAELEYENQSGALNESYSDVFGEFFEASLGSVDWLVGAGLASPAPVTGRLRDMQFPNLAGQPDHMLASVSSDGMGYRRLPSGTDPDCDANDCGFVHTNSGIPNKAAYLIINGGTHNGLTVTGIGIEKAMQLYYATLTGRLSDESQLRDARNATVAQAQSYARLRLRGFTSGDVCSVINAFASVGLGDADRDCDGMLDSTDTDDDGDFALDSRDNCPIVTNFSQSDIDSDGIGDACDPDVDGDGIPNDGDASGAAGDNPCTGGSVDGCDDNAPLVTNADQRDDDFDGIGEVIDDDDGDGIVNPRDNCRYVRNFDQANADRDSRGDACDPDNDNDGVLDDGDGSGVEGDNPCTGGATTDCDDNSPVTYNPDQHDFDADRVGDMSDNCAYVANEDQLDTDGDGRGNACDDDDDGDHVPDHRDSCPFDADPFQFDFDGNGVGLLCDPSEASLLSGDVAAELKGIIRFIDPGGPVRIPVNPCQADGCPDYLPEGYGTFVALTVPVEMMARIVDDRGFVVAKDNFGTNKLLHFPVNADFHYRAPLAIPGSSLTDAPAGRAAATNEFIQNAGASDHFTNDYSTPVSDRYTGGGTWSQQPVYRGRHYFLEIFPPADSQLADMQITIQVVSGVHPAPPDLSPPTLASVPDDLTFESPDGSKVTVNYQLPTAVDDVDPNPTVVCSPPSGTQFPLGSTRVTCTATDAAGHSSSADFHVTVHDTTGPTVQDVELIANQSAIVGMVLKFSESLEGGIAANVNNYSLLSLGRDGRAGTRDDRIITLQPPVYDGASHAVTLHPTTPLAINRFYRLTVNGQAGLIDLAGNRLDGNGDHTPGPDDDYQLTIGRGTHLSYDDAGGDTVTLTLTGGGMMELTRGLDGEGQDLRLVEIVANQTSLTGSVRKPKKSPTADAITTLRSIQGLAGVRNKLPSSQFRIGSISAMVIDSLLSRGITAHEFELPLR
jgi:Zn-dependent metalloprotease